MRISAPIKIKLINEKPHETLRKRDFSNDFSFVKSTYTNIYNFMGYPNGLCLTLKNTLNIQSYFDY